MNVEFTPWDRLERAPDAKRDVWMQHVQRGALGASLRLWIDASRSETAAVRLRELEKAIEIWSQRELVLQVDRALATTPPTEEFRFTRLEPAEIDALMQQARRMFALAGALITLRFGGGHDVLTWLLRALHGGLNVPSVGPTVSAVGETMPREVVARRLEAAVDELEKIHPRDGDWAAIRTCYGLLNDSRAKYRFDRVPVLMYVGHEPSIGYLKFTVIPHGRTRLTEASERLIVFDQEWHDAVAASWRRRRELFETHLVNHDVVWSFSGDRPRSIGSSFQATFEACLILAATGRTLKPKTTIAAAVDEVSGELLKAVGGVFAAQPEVGPKLIAPLKLGPKLIAAKENGITTVVIAEEQWDPEIWPTLADRERMIEFAASQGITLQTSLRLIDAIVFAREEVPEDPKPEVVLPVRIDPMAPVEPRPTDVTRRSFAELLIYAGSAAFYKFDRYFTWLPHARSPADRAPSASRFLESFVAASEWSIVPGSANQHRLADNKTGCSPYVAAAHDVISTLARSIRPLARSTEVQYEHGGLIVEPKDANLMFVGGPVSNKATRTFTEHDELDVFEGGNMKVLPRFSDAPGGCLRWGFFCGKNAYGDWDGKHLTAKRWEDGEIRSRPLYSFIDRESGVRHETEVVDGFLMEDYMIVTRRPHPTFPGKHLTFIGGMHGHSLVAFYRQIDEILARIDDEMGTWDFFQVLLPARLDHNKLKTNATVATIDLKRMIFHPIRKTIAEWNRPLEKPHVEVARSEDQAPTDPTR